MVPGAGGGQGIATPAPGELFVAIDAGTTGARASAVDLEGRLVHEARHGYAVRTPRPGWAEQDPRDWVAMSLRALGDLAGAVGGERIAGIGLTGQCPTVAPVDAHGGPVGPGLLYRDNRALAQAEEMRRRIGEAEMHARTGHIAQAFHVGPKVLWWRERDRAVFDAATRFMQPRDMVMEALSGVSATDETHAAATLFFDLRRRAWADDLLEIFELSRSVFPDAYPSRARLGSLRSGQAEAVGLPADCPIVLGAADSQCAAFGSAVVAPGPVSEMSGASSCLNSAVREPLANLQVTHYSHVVEGMYTTELGVNTSGAAVAWARQMLGFPDYESLQAAARSTHRRLRSGAGGNPLELAPLFLPYLSDGERDEVTLRGAFVGLSERHDRSALAYAVLEGVAFAVGEAISILRSSGSPAEELRVGGGGARLAVLGEIKADALAIPVVHMETDTAPVGVAMLAASACGRGEEALAAIEEGVRRADRYEPDSGGSDAIAERSHWFDRVRASDAVRAPAPGAAG